MRSQGSVALTCESFLVLSTPSRKKNQVSDASSYLHSLFSALPFFVVVISMLSIFGGFGFRMLVTEYGSPATQLDL